MSYPSLIFLVMIIFKGRHYRAIRHLMNAPLG